MSKTMINDLTEGNLFKKLVSFSIPFMLANLLNTLYNLVDLAVVGEFVGSTGVSAVSISGQVTFFLYAVGMGLGTGGQILVSHQIGAKEYNKLNRSIGTIMSFNFIASIVVALAGGFGARWLMSLLNTPPEAMEEAVGYLTICSFGIPFIYGYGTMCGILRGMGDSKRPLIIVAVAALTNMVVDVLLVAVFHLGTRGTAIATVFSQILSCVFAMTYLYKRREQFGFDFKLSSFKIDWKILWVVLQLSMPLIFMNLSVSISLLYVMSYINDYGLVAASVYGIGTKFYSIMTIVTNAIQAAIASCVGQNIAAGKIARAKKCVYIGWVICLAAFVIIAIPSFFCPELMFDLFSNDAAVLEMSREFMHIFVWNFFAFALMSPVLGLVNGVGFTSFNLIVALLDGVVARIGLSILLGVTLGFGLHGFWWGTVISSYVSVVIPGIYFLSGKWKKRKLLTEKI